MSGDVLNIGVPGQPSALSATNGIQLQNTNLSGLISLANNSTLTSSPNSQIYLDIGQSIPTNFGPSDPAPAGMTVTPTAAVGTQVFFHGNINGPQATISVQGAGQIFLRSDGPGTIVLNPGSQISLSPIAFGETTDTAMVAMKSDALRIWRKVTESVFETLFEATNDTVVQLNSSAVWLKKGAVVLVRRSCDEFEIYNLKDHKYNDVAVGVSGRKIVIGPGQSVHVGKGSVRVAYRGMKDLGADTLIHEFSLPSLYTLSKLIRLIAGDSSSSAQRMFNDVLKAQCAIYVVTGSKGHYSAPRRGASSSIQ